MAVSKEASKPSSCSILGGGGFPAPPLLAPSTAPPRGALEVGVGTLGGGTDCCCCCFPPPPPTLLRSLADAPAWKA